MAGNAAFLILPLYIRPQFRESHGIFKEMKEELLSFAVPNKRDIGTEEDACLVCTI